MTHTPYTGLDEIAFRPFLPWYLVKNGLLLALGVTCLVIAIRSGHVWWWIGVALAMLAALVLAIHYTAQALIIRGNDLVIRSGLLKTYELSIPLWQVDLETRQSLLGRIFDYGTVLQRTDRSIITLHNIASMRALRFVFAERRQQALALLLERRILTLNMMDRRNIEPAQPSRIQQAITPGRHP
jgi:hypothetical protein